ncbi:MAG: hypothetical protein EBZ13_12995 [Planctomycetia bacterium]|nr:hypothetical protein [Planctomycetia bacterium]
MVSRHASSLLFRRLVGPVIGLLLFAVLANLAVAAWLAAHRTTAAAAAVEQQVTGAVAASRVPLAPPILTALHQLTSCHFLIADSAAPAGIFSTAAATEQPATNWRAVLAGTTPPPDRVQLPSGEYRVSLFRSQSIRPQQVVLLIPLPAVTRVVFESVAPMLVVAGVMLAILIPLGLSVTGRLTRRIIAIEGLVGRIAAGAFGSQLVAGEPDESVPPGFEVLRVHLNMVGYPQSLSEFLNEVYRSSPYLQVLKLNMGSATKRQSRRRSNQAPSEQDDQNLTLDVHIMALMVTA